MGRKRIHPSKRRVTLSLSFNQSTVALIDEHLSISASRSQFIERIVLNHLQNAKYGHDEVPFNILTTYQCVPCEKNLVFTAYQGKEMMCKECAQMMQMIGQEKVNLE